MIFMIFRQKWLFFLSSIYDGKEELCAIFIPLSPFLQALIPPITYNPIIIIGWRGSLLLEFIALFYIY